MTRIEQSIVVNRPVEEVFAFYTDLSNNTQWESAILEVRQISEGPSGVGTTWKVVRQQLGRRMEQTLEVTEWEPNRKVSYNTTSKPVPMKASLTFESVEGATKITAVANIQFGGVFKLAKPIVVLMVNNRLKADYQNLKKLLESRA